MSRSYLRAIYLRLAGAVMLVIVAALAGGAYFSHQVFERTLAPEMASKVASGGSSARSVLLRAMEHSVAFKEIYGIEQTFDELKAAIPDIAYVAVTDAAGEIAYQRFTPPAGAAAYFRRPEVLARFEVPQPMGATTRLGNQYMVSLPIVSAGQQRVGMLHIGVSIDFINRVVTDMVFDLLVVLLVALFVTLELLHFLAGQRIEKALKSLGDAFEHGAAGDFRATVAAETEGAFTPVVRALEAVRQRVNHAFGLLVQEIDQVGRRPAHERPAALDAVRNGMLMLARRFQFGVATEAAERSDDDGHLAKVRAPLFAFILAEELTRPFLPGYVKDLLVPVPWLSPEIVVGLPIVLFMLIVALGQPWMGAYSERVGNRRAMLTGAVIAAIGFLASAMANSVLDLLIWRSLCALGYGLVFVAAQAHVLEFSGGAGRARSFAVFIGAIMVATVCGPSIGGILADNIGERMTLVVSALLALASTAAIQLMPALPEARTRGAGQAPRLRDFGALLLNGRFMTVTGLAAIPAKVLLTGMCFYLVPLFLLSIDSSQAVAGRVLMVYGIVMVLVTPLAANFANTRARMERLVATGLVVSGAGGMMLLAGDHVLWVFAAVLLVGLGQAMSMAAQSALVREHCEQEVGRMGEPVVYGVYRLLERLGNAFGPILAALLVMAVGYRHSFVVIGAAVMACGVVFALLTFVFHSRAVRAAVQPA